VEDLVGFVGYVECFGFLWVLGGDVYGVGVGVV